jgi:inhibitor of KinA
VSVSSKRAAIPALFSPLGDHAVTITVGDSIDEATHRRVRAISAILDARPVAGVVDQVPAFASLVVHYAPERVDGDPSEPPYQRLVKAITEVLAHVGDEALPPSRTTEVPVCYGGELGPDLEDVARQHAMTPSDVIDIHTGGDYLVYMVGFMPGFAYLGGLDERLVTPRRTSPRTAVPAGTVGIGGQQTGVYPLVSPGGWNLIGQTPLRIFDVSRQEPALLLTGDRVRFRAISLAEFTTWGAP